LRIETSLGWKAIFTDSSVSDTLRSMSDIALAGDHGRGRPSRKLTLDLAGRMHQGEPPAVGRHQAQAIRSHLQ